jgi:xylulokinase
MYLGIDIGTSSVKTVLFDRDQKLVGQASQHLSVSRPHPGWSEQDPEDWWRAVEGTIGTIARDHDIRSLRGIGLSGQMHGAVCLDVDDRVLRPAILWNDGRAMDECAEIEAAFPRARKVAGNIAMPGFTAPKIAWMRKHEPDLYDRIDAVLLPKDYVRGRPPRLAHRHRDVRFRGDGTLDAGAVAARPQRPLRTRTQAPLVRLLGRRHHLGPRGR